MNVGDYLRDNKGNIAKIIEVERVKNWLTVRYDNAFNHATGITYNLIHFKNEEEILEYNHIKSSPKIIDLIEEHDILKIEEQKGIFTICEVEVFKEPYGECTFLGVRIDNRPIARKLYELNIKSIVTKEQFENMEYKIGE